jgi:hypothetical protein
MDANTIVKEHFWEEIGKSLSADGEVASVAINVDTEKAQEAFGIKFQSFEEQVKDSVKSYLSLPWRLKVCGDRLIFHTNV